MNNSVAIVSMVCSRNLGVKMAERSSDTRKPTEVYDEPWIYQMGPNRSENVLGKWLVFKHITVIDKNWENIRRAVESGELGAVSAKVSTMANPERPTDGDREQKVICVYTTKETMDDVGMKLIQLVNQTIRYKTDEATQSGRYTCLGDGKVTCRTLAWNNGRPKFTD